MRQNQVLARLRAGEATMGLWMFSGSPLIAEGGAQAGFDWVLLDTQHGHWGTAELLAATQVVSASRTAPLARVLRNDPGLIGSLLDMGIMGIIVPLVNSAEEAALAVAAMRYPPLGQRSFGGQRLSYYGSDYYPAANHEVMAAVMIETGEAVERAEEILGVPGVDLGFIGPLDLALSLGVPFGSAEHEAAIQHVLQAGRRRGVPVGIYTGTTQEAKRRAAQGFQFMPLVTDLPFLQQGLNAAVQEWRKG